MTMGVDAALTPIAFLEMPLILPAAGSASWAARLTGCRYTIENTLNV